MQFVRYMSGFWARCIKQKSDVYRYIRSGRDRLGFYAEILDYFRDNMQNSPRRGDILRRGSIVLEQGHYAQY